MFSNVLKNQMRRKKGNSQEDIKREKFKFLRPTLAATSF